jgi:hypothetical protein
MTHALWDPSAVDPRAPEQRSPQRAASMPEPRSPAGKATTAHDRASFDAGQDCGTRVAACIARLTALELIDGSRWWNRWRLRRMAGALVAYAEDLESAADAAPATAGGAMRSVRSTFDRLQGGLTLRPRQRAAVDVPAASADPGTRDPQTTRYAGTEVQLDGEEHLVIREEDILGVVEGR